MADRSEYWKKRWAEQKSKGNAPDRHEYYCGTISSEDFEIVLTAKGNNKD